MFFNNTRFMSSLPNNVPRLPRDPQFLSLLRGSSVTLLAKILAVSFSFFSSLFIARFYGSDILGIIAIINSVLSISIILSSMGTHVALLRKIPEHISKYSLYSARLIFKKLGISAFLLSLLFALMLLISSNSIASYVFCKDYLAAFFMLSSPVLVFSVNQQLNTEALRALGKTRLYSLFIFLPSLFNFFLLAVFTFIFFDPNLPVYLYLLVPIIISPLSLFAVKKCFGGTNSLGCHRVESFSTLLNLSFPMFVTSFLVLIISQADFVLLGIFATEKEVGIYHVVIKLASMTSFVLMSINSILAPKFSELYYGKKLLELKSIGVAATKLAVLISTPILFMTLLFGKWLLSLFGQEFVIGFSALAIVVFGQFVHTITGSVGYFLNMSGHQRQLRNLMVLSAILSVMLNLTLIPKYGILGSAVANTSAVIFWNISGSIYMKRKYGFALSYIPFVFKKSGN